MPNTYSTSKGKRLTRQQIENKIKYAKKKKDEKMLDSFGYIFCQRCKRNTSNCRIHKSHIVSIKYALENSIAEVSFDVDDLENLCHECHTYFEDTFTNAERLLYYNLIKKGLTYIEFIQYIESELEHNPEIQLKINRESGTDNYIGLFD